MSAKFRASVVSHTHWDREWYWPFEGFRMRLVGLIDELIAKMESDPRYRFFNFDGQAILFRDYLEIRPEMEPRLRALCQAGRIIAGPMYVAPDESLPGAETHVRNFLLGRKIAGEWGRVLESGYAIDVFGHISQWPQILRGFGIDNAILMRGVNDETCGAEFIWESPDGSDVLAIHLTNSVSYSDFWYKVRMADEGKLLDLDAALVRLEDLVAWQRERHSTSEILLMDGVDHIEVQPDVPDLIEMYNAKHSDEGEMVHEALPDYLQRLREAMDRDKLVTLTGELRSPNHRSPLGQVFFGYHCSHPELKAYNDRCEGLLQYWAEPLMASNFLLTGEYDPAFLWHAWEQLLQNQPHDSICGCSVDQVHKDMIYRYDQCRIVAEQIVVRQSKALAARQSVACDEPGAWVAHIINPTGAPIAGTTIITLPIPHPRAERFRLIAPDGTEVPWQLVSETKAVPEPEVNWNCIPRFPAKDQVTIAALLDIPACGMAAYKIVPTDRPNRTPETLLPRPGLLANELIEVAAADDGSLSLWDKRSGRVFCGILRFEDRGDVGDGWNYWAPLLDQAVLSGPAQVSVVCEGPLCAALRIETTMSIPVSASADRRSRSTERVDMRIVSTVAICKDDPSVCVETVVDNPARDHKLRVLCPTGLVAETWFSDSPFDLNERPIKVQETSDWDEPAQEIWWQQSLCAVTDGEDGLAIIAPECKESACIDDESRTLALSLFRAFGQTVGTRGEDGPQMLGRNVFEFQIVPFQGPLAEAGLLNRAAQMRAGLKAVVLPPHEGELPASVGLVELSPEWLALSAVKKREAGEELIVRFFNPSPEAVEAEVRFPMGVAQAWRSDLKEDLLEELAVTDGMVRLSVRGKEIVTLAVRRG